MLYKQRSTIKIYKVLYTLRILKSSFLNLTFQIPVYFCKFSDIHLSQTNEVDFKSFKILI